MIFLISIVLAMTNGISQTNLINITMLNESSFDNLTEEKLDIIVVFKEEIDEVLLEQNDVEVKENLESIDVSTVKATMEAIEKIQKDIDVESVELDIDLELFGEGNTINLEEQITPWGIERVNAPNVWNEVTGKDIKIAIIDSGINKDHLDLGKNVRGGISFVEDRDYWDDDLRHGTSVAGVISALNNEIGVVGMAPDSEIYSVKVIGSSGGKLSNFIQGIEWAIDNDMDIIVMSLGIPVDSPSLRRIVDEAYLEGIILVAASGKDNQIYYPAKYSSVIAVGSIDESNQLTDENGEGDELEFVAPGQNIISTNINGYGSFDGTSMSAPHVAGVLALLKENDPSLSINELRAKLQRGVIDLGDEGKDDYFGYGLVNINLKEENLDAIIQIVFPEENDETKKEELEINPIKVEIIKIENEKEIIVQTLFYDGNKGTQDISVESGQYNVKQYFDDKIYSDEYIVNEGDIVIVPLHKVKIPVHQWIAYQASFIWSTNEIMEYMEEEKYNSQNVWGMAIDPFLDDDGYNNYNDDLDRAEGILVGSGEEDEDTQGEYQCGNDYLVGNPYCYHFWEPDNPQEGSYNDGISIYGSAITVAQVQYDKAISLYNNGDKNQSYYWLGRVTHLITDMTVPAHVHLDQHVTNDDAFEDFMAKSGEDVYDDWKEEGVYFNVMHFNGLNYVETQYNYESLISGFGWEDVKTDSSNLFNLFWYTAQKTQYHASDDWDYTDDIWATSTNNYYAIEDGTCLDTSGGCSLFSGGVNNEYLWDGEGITIIYNKDDIEDGHWSGLTYYDDDEGPNLAKIAEANIPHAMKAVAGLYRLFWAEVDADGDNINNLYDNCWELSNSNQANNDEDEEGDVCDSDDDNDGYLDVNDAFPFDSAEWLDTDLDGIGDNADTDDDDDTYNDTIDSFPTDPTEWSDNDVDGTGDNADLDDDNDEVLDLNDSCSFTYGQNYEQGCPDLIPPEVTLNLSSSLVLGNEALTITCDQNDTDPNPIHNLMITKPSNETVELNCSTAVFNETDEEGEYQVYFEAIDGGNNSASINDTFTVDLCLPNWVSTGECQEDDSLLANYTDENGCYILTNLTSDIENKPEDTIDEFSCDYNEDGFIGEIDNINTTLENITKEINETSIKLNENNNPLIEFEFNLTEEQINLANLFIEKQNNESNYSYMIIRGLDLISQNQTKIIYLDKILGGTGLCIKDEELLSISEISDNCAEENETWIACPNVNGDYSCELINNETQYKISGLRHSGIKEQETYCGDGNINGNEECESGNIPKSCGDYEFNAGSLSCTASCTIDSSACFTQDTGGGGGSGGGGGGGGSGGGGGGSSSSTTNTQTTDEIATTTSEDETDTPEKVVEDEPPQEDIVEEETQTIWQRIVNFFRGEGPTGATITGAAIGEDGKSNKGNLGILIISLLFIVGIAGVLIWHGRKKKTEKLKISN